VTYSWWQCQALLDGLLYEEWAVGGTMQSSWWHAVFDALPGPFSLCVSALHGAKRDYAPRDDPDGLQSEPWRRTVEGKAGAPFP